MGEDLNYNYYCEPPVPHKKDDCEVTGGGGGEKKKKKKKKN